MSWYNTQGPDQNYVLFSKVRYIRNIAKQSFYHLADAKRSSEVFAKLESVLQKNGFRGEKLEPGATYALWALAEKQLIESDIVNSEKPRSLYLNEPCNLIVALGGENYITISSIVAGSSVDEAKNMASGAEELLDREIDFAYSENIGYLSPICADCGSGLCFSAGLYLPSLRLADSQDMLRLDLSKKGLYLTPMFSGCAGDIYILSYVPHYLACEKDATAFFSHTVSYITENENSALSSILANSSDILLNSARRALGALIYSDFLSENELLGYLSEIRICHCISTSTPDSLPSISALNYLCAEGLDYSVIVSSKESCSSDSDCNKARARLVSSYIKHKNEVDMSNGK